jgi:adenylate cyclase
VERKLAAILAADVVGYSRLMGQDEARTLERLKHIHKHAVQPRIEARNGRVVKLMGDGLLAEFPSIVEAVQCATDIQEALLDGEAAYPQDEQIRLRIGLNLGDVIVEGADIFGDGVNVAARLEGLAPSGGICISGAAYDAIDGKLDLPFEDLGAQVLKNIVKPVRVYKLSFTRAQGGSPRKPEQNLEITDKPSIAVLPFKNLSGDSDNDYFSEGVTEEITSTLSRIRDFFVIARATTQSFQDGSNAVDIIHGQFGVRYVLRGSVRQSANRVRVSAELADCNTHRTIWSDRFDSVLDDLFDVQDEISKQVAGAIHPTIRMAEIARAKKKRPDSLDAYDLVMRAYPHLWAHDRDRNREALKLLKSALILSPTYSLAAALAGWCHAQEAVYLWSDEPETEKEEALKLAESSVSTLEDDATALAALSAVFAMCAHDLGRALHFAGRAVEIDPNHAWAWSRFGWAQHFAGHADESLDCFKKALSLSPLDPLAFNIYFGLAANEAVGGNFEAAAQLTEKGLLENPAAKWANRMLASYAANANQLDKAKAALSELLAVSPNLTIRKVRAGMPNITPDYMEPMITGLRKAGLPE